MARPSLVLISRRGRASIDRCCMADLEQRAHVTVVQRDRALHRAEAIDLLADADLLGSTNVCLPTMDAGLLDALPRLRGIILYASGYDNLDTALLRARGIGLSVVPGYATTAVAEHCVAMLLALATRLHLANDRSRGIGPAEVSLRGMELAGKTLGVIGLGRIGSHVARLGGALGTTVIGTDIDPHTIQRGWEAEVPMGTLDWVLHRSDAVAMCASRAFGAPPVLAGPELCEIRSGALLVNVGRSALVDTAAALAAIRAGRLRGYAVDDTVVDPAHDGDLLAEGRVLQTGHSAWWKDEVLGRGARMWGERLLAAVAGTPIDVVTWPGVEVVDPGSVVVRGARP